MKKYLIWLMTISMVMTMLAGCKKGPETTPEEDLTTFLEAFKTQNTEVLKEYNLNSYDLGVEEEQMDPASASFLQLMTNITYTVKEVKKEGDHQVVMVSLDHIRFKDAFLHIIDVLTVKAVEMALDSMDGTDLGDEKIVEESNKMIQEEVKNILEQKLYRTTDDVLVTMVESEGKWKVDLEQSKEFIDTLIPDESSFPDIEGVNKASADTAS